MYRTDAHIGLVHTVRVSRQSIECARLHHDLRRLALYHIYIRLFPVGFHLGHEKILIPHPSQHTPLIARVYPSIIVVGDLSHTGSTGAPRIQEIRIRVCEDFY